MTRRDECLEQLLHDGSLSNVQLAENMGISEGYAKKLIHQLKKAEVIEIEDVDGQRIIKVNEERVHNKRVEKNVFRKARIEQVLDIVTEAMEHETHFDNLINAGHLIVKLLDRL